MKSSSRARARFVVLRGSVENAVIERCISLCFGLGIGFQRWWYAEILGRTGFENRCELVVDVVIGKLCTW